jgi:hypothetical protein
MKTALLSLLCLLSLNVSAMAAENGHGMTRDELLSGLMGNLVFKAAINQALTAYGAPCVAKFLKFEERITPSGPSDYEYEILENCGGEFEGKYPAIVKIRGIWSTKLSNQDKQEMSLSVHFPILHE